jgi:hypothetical protein
LSAARVFRYSAHIRLPLLHVASGNWEYLARFRPPDTLLVYMTRPGARVGLAPT